MYIYIPYIFFAYKVCGKLLHVNHYNTGMVFNGKMMTFIIISQTLNDVFKVQRHKRKLKLKLVSATVAFH